MQKQTLKVVSKMPSTFDEQIRPVTQEEFIEFRSFPSLNLAAEMAQALEQEGIPVELADTMLLGSQLLSAQANSVQYLVKLRQCDFEKAEDLVKKHFGAGVNEVGSEYYLFQFTNGELYGVLRKYDEWASHDFDMAADILRNRGESLSDKDLKDYKEKRYQILAQPDKEAKGIVFYAIAAVLTGSFMGFFWGWDLWQGTKLLPDGKRVYSYNQKDRRLGKHLFIASFILLPVTLLVLLYRASLLDLIKHYVD